MNNKYILSAFLCISAMTFSGCIEEHFENSIPVTNGDEVIFGARAGFENSDTDTRTVYTGETYESNGKKFERIDWVTGSSDMIEVYCAEANNGPKSHYKVNSGADDHDKDQGKDFATLSKMGDSSLQWSGNTDHTFYAMYPSGRMFDTTSEDGEIVTVDMGVEMNKETLTGVVPSYQASINITETTDPANGKTVYVVEPDMRYAYMAAKTTASANPVKLSFIPLVTAVEIELTLADNPDGKTYQDVYVGEIQIESPQNSDGIYTQAIAGTFTSDLSGWDGTDYPDCSISGTGEGRIQISTRMKTESSEIAEPICLKPGQSLRFTVFMLPTADISNLIIKYSADGAAAYKSKTLATTFPAHLKTKITNLALPATTEEIVVDASKWMSQLPQTTSLRKLSLPGTGGSFSYNYTESDAEYYSQQTLDLDEQWTAGIRAFEVIVNRPTVSTTSLGEQYVKCNKKSMGRTFDEVMTDLTNKVNNSTECAVVILTYQPEGASPYRDGASFASSLNVWYQSFTNKSILQKYTPDLTLQEAKGSVMVIVRLNQKDEKEGFVGSVQDGITNYSTAVTTLKDTPFVLVNGCGTSKDRWGARGYRINGTSFPHISNSASGTNVIESFMENSYIFTTDNGVYTTSYTSGSNTVTRAEANSPDQIAFNFDTSDSNITCWYQEWARVVATPYTREASDGFLGIGGNSACRWFESYYEKLNNAIVSFDMAVDSDPRYSQYIFINSLCGYLVTSSFGDSYVQSTGSTYGGSGGDIKGLADLITPAFYNHVYNRSMDNTTGPTGIIMMDYVSNDPADGGSCFLPGLIIANNFKYN